MNKIEKLEMIHHIEIAENRKVFHFCEGNEVFIRNRNRDIKVSDNPKQALTTIIKAHCYNKINKETLIKNKITDYKYLIS